MSLCGRNDNMMEILEYGPDCTLGGDGGISGVGHQGLACPMKQRSLCIEIAIVDLIVPGIKFVNYLPEIASP